MQKKMMTQEELQRRQEALERRMARNAQVTTLAPESHKVLETICSDRHLMHSHPDDILLNTNAGRKYRRGLLGTIAALEAIQELSTDGKLLTAVKEALQEIDIIRKEYEVADNIHKPIHLKEFLEQQEKINVAVTKFLKKIDRQHHTHYAPCGKYRTDVNSEKIATRKSNRAAEKKAKRQEAYENGTEKSNSYESYKSSQDDWMKDMEGMFDADGNYIGGSAEDIEPWSPSVAAWQPHMKQKGKDMALAI